ncbi:hypothetical protein J2Z69_001812 [Paenibacillus shirakamiensis]|uniref:Uncharacterized protein n=1 Tax=Paenibacillus shirakamiensis TaxID=1265935 RepID=A0ABS4JGC9_9BACL|nr:hypothetical protein [Paenibacillus shirakamiensis]MBP2000781.1 hypothetical protein [Paenibacillus shirakamiensis]
METLDEILNGFSVMIIQSGGELYLPIQVASEFIQKCYDNNLAISGIDFVHIINNRIMPVSPINSMDASLLLGENRIWRNSILECKNFALSVIQKELERDSEQFCNFVVLSENDLPPIM